MSPIAKHIYTTCNHESWCILAHIYTDLLNSYRSMSSHISGLSRPRQKFAQNCKTSWDWAVPSSAQAGFKLILLPISQTNWVGVGLSWAELRMELLILMIQSQVLMSRLVRMVLLMILMLLLALLEKWLIYQELNFTVTLLSFFCQLIFAKLSFIFNPVEDTLLDEDIWPPSLPPLIEMK